MQPISTNTDTELLHLLETKLGQLAARWRGTKNAQDSDMIVHNYQAILRCMIELGYHDSLDVDAELPDEYLPPEYFALFS